jgi:membrane protein
MSRPLSAKFFRWFGPSLRVFVQEVERGELSSRAAALTFFSLLALVPAFALAYGLFAAYGGLDIILAKAEFFLVNTLHAENPERFLSVIRNFAAKDSSGPVRQLSLLVLLYTVLSTFGTIERAFNDIWAIEKRRGWVQRFQVYWPLFTLGPLLLGGALSLISIVARHADTFVYGAPLLGFLATVAPFLLIGVLFTLLYLIMPNTRVRIRSAMLSGAVSAGVWVAGQSLFAEYALRAETYRTLYGSLGVIPLFTVWVYVSWLIALLGAVLARTLEQRAVGAAIATPASFRRPRDITSVTHIAMLYIAEAFTLGKGPVSTHALATALDLPPTAVHRILEPLIGKKLLIAIDEKDTLAYSLARPADKIALADYLSEPSDETVPSPPRFRKALETFQGTRARSLRHAFSQTTVAEALLDTGTSSPTSIP